eukprot:1361414-Amorphochlora_amoeboformis.AAC.1
MDAKVAAGLRQQLEKASKRLRNAKYEFQQAPTHQRKRSENDVTGLELMSTSMALAGEAVHSGVLGREFARY